ncbi:MAG: transposase, partial [Bacteroidia bacterium]|nr:transposase [Bacteroidia bacterium]
MVIKSVYHKGRTQIVILFSTNLSLSASDIIHYYALRFEIEFDFRDAKQHFGLNDFKDYKPTSLKNFVSMSFFMTFLKSFLKTKEKNA